MITVHELDEFSAWAHVYEPYALLRMDVEAVSESTES